MGSHSHLPPGRGSTPALTPAVTGRYLIYPLIKDERLSRPEPTQANNLPRVATEVLTIPGVSWLSRPSAPLWTGVNNYPTAATQWLASGGRPLTPPSCTCILHLSPLSYCLAATVLNTLSGCYSMTPWCRG